MQCHELIWLRGMGANHVAFLVLVIAEYLDYFKVVIGNGGVSKLFFIQDSR